MGQEEQFDSFYLATRRGLLLQTFALTGDLPAAQRAVRDAYVLAWHHWRKVARQPRPVDWVRPRAWQLAHRRHSTRLWHRTHDLTAENTAVLETVAGLTGVQRKALLLTHLAGVPLPEAAREIGIPQAQAEQQLQIATAAFAIALGTDSAAVRHHLLPLAEVTESAPLPRASVLRRSGTKRRRTHTLVAAASAAALAVTAGAFVHDPGGGPDPAPSAGTAAAPGGASGSPEAGPSASAAAAEPTLPTTDTLLEPGQLAGLGRGWRIAETHDNTAGDGLNTVCQETRFADPDGLSTLVREFSSRSKPRREALQTVEISRTPGQAEAAYATMAEWYAGCTDGRAQLLRAFDVEGVGDQAALFLVRDWDRPATTSTVAVARVGQVVTSTVVESRGSTAPPRAEVVDALTAAVGKVCDQALREGCVRRPRVSAVPPPPSGEVKGLLAVTDLPPVTGVTKPWVGTAGRPARRNPAATSCDRASFVRAGAEATRTRTFLVPEARLPSRFGLSESYGAFASPRAAERFVGEMAQRVASCEDGDLPTSVSALGRVGGGPGGSDGRVRGQAWRVRMEVSESETVEFLVAFVRNGRYAAQLTFAPAEGATMSATTFRGLALRAGERLTELR